MTLCYFGIYARDFSRNKIYIEGLRARGIDVRECVDTTPGIRKWFRLWKKLRGMRGQYDVVVVGYPGHLAVPFAKIFSRKPVVADLLGSLYDAEKNSHKPTFWKLCVARLADFLAVRFSDVILLESHAQKKYFEERFGKSSRYEVVYTGTSLASDHTYTPRTEDFVVIFRGSLTPECGIDYILESASLLSDDPRLSFLIVGRGMRLRETERTIEEKKLIRVQLISRYLSAEEMQREYDKASLALGQFDANPRLSRTIPHKAFEAFALGIPYLSGEGEAVRELVEDGKTGFLCPLGNASALAEKIRELSHNVPLLERVSQNEKSLFDTEFSPRILAGKLLLLCERLV